MYTSCSTSSGSSSTTRNAVLKFAAHPLFAHRLRATGSASLVEVSPTDRIWANGATWAETTAAAHAGQAAGGKLTCTEQMQNASSAPGLPRLIA